MNLAIFIKNKVNAGVTLVEIVVSLGISSILLAVAYQQFNDMQESFASIEIDADINDITQRIQKTINCEATLADPNSIKLRDKQNQRLFKDHALGGVFSGSERVNRDYFVKSTWNGNGISIQLAKKSKSSQAFAKDPLTGRTLGFSESRMQIFDAPPLGIPLCPQNSTSSDIARVTSIQIRDISPFLNNSLDTTVYNTYLRPIAFKLGCHEYCRSQNYVTGFTVECSDTCGYVTNPSGHMTATMCQPGYGGVDCTCLL
jgi:prepilin-type N-terminal cleavage/methylation domain-containing protein